MTIVAAVAIIGIGALASINLFVLNNLYWRSVKAGVVRETDQSGARLAVRLADLPIVQRGIQNEEDLHHFSRIVRSYDRFVPSLAYVSLKEDGAILFQASPRNEEEEARLAATERSSMTAFENVSLNGRVVPVKTFSVDVATTNGARRTIEVAIRQGVAGENGDSSSAALFHLFRISLSTIAVGFIASVLLVGWLIRRELRRVQLRRRQENLAFAGAMATGIIHDFRNPMSALRLDLQLLGKEVERGGDARLDRIADLSDRARNTLDRLDDILKEFQHLARPEDESFMPVDVNEAIRDCLNLLASRFVKAGVRTRVELDPDPLTVMASPTGLKRAILNILVNAEQASPRGGEVSVRSRMFRGEAWIEIADQGPGIPVPKRGQIFDLFVSSKPGGFGLGLPLAKAAVHSFRGSIAVADSDGGACFQIRLPLAAARTDDSPGRPSRRR